MGPRFRTWHSPSFMLTRLVVDITGVYYLCREVTIPRCILIIAGNAFTLATLRISNVKQMYRLIDETLAQAVEWIIERFPERQAQGSNQQEEQMSSEASARFLPLDTCLWKCFLLDPANRWCGRDRGCR